jgi:cAMP-dependent protein kinase regulator
MHTPWHYAVPRPAARRQDVANRIALADLRAARKAGSLPEADLLELRAAGSETVIPAGRVLTEPGQPGSGIYVVIEGSVRVQAPERTVELGPGALLGDRSLRTRNGKRTARVQALTPVRVLAIERTRLEELAARDPAVRELLAC